MRPSSHVQIKQPFGQCYENCDNTLVRMTKQETEQNTRRHLIAGHAEGPPEAMKR